MLSTPLAPCRMEEVAELMVSKRAAEEAEARARLDAATARAALGEALSNPRGGTALRMGGCRGEGDGTGSCLALIIIIALSGSRRCKLYDLLQWVNFGLETCSYIHTACSRALQHAVLVRLEPLPPCSYACLARQVHPPCPALTPCSLDDWGIRLTLGRGQLLTRLTRHSLSPNADASGGGVVWWGGGGDRAGVFDAVQA